MARRRRQHHFEGEGPVPYREDRELLRRVGLGDAEAFEPFLRRHADAAFRLARFLSADAPTARRIVVGAFAETFAAVYPKEEAAGEKEKPPGPPAEYARDLGAWILSITKRLAFAEPPIPPPSRAIDATGGSRDPASFRRVRELDVELREAICLRHAEGDDKLGCASIGKVCGVPAETAAGRLAGARHDLARIVGGLSEGDAPAEPEKPGRSGGESGGPGRLGTGTGIELFVVLSRHIDEELPPERSSEVEQHLKESGRCREEIAALRGADRFAARAIEGVADPGLVDAVMEALSLHSRAVPMGGRRVPRLFLWAAILAVALLAGALVASGFHALFGGKEKERRVLELCLGDESHLAVGRTPQWRVSEPGKADSAEAPPGSRVTTGTELELAPSRGHGALFRPDGLRLYMEAGTRFRIADDATDERGFILERGCVLALAPEGARPFELAFPGGALLRFARIAGKGVTARVLVEALDRGAAVIALTGAVRVSRGGEELELRTGERAAVGARRRGLVAGRVDLRALALDFVPARLRPSPWPARGGSAARSGASPFRFAGPPKHASGLDGVLGASAVVLGPEGTAYFLAGPPPGRLVAIDGTTGRLAAASAPFASPCTGDPALGPDGRIYVCTRDGAVLAFDPGGETLEPATIVPPSPGDLPRTGPALGPDGSIYVVYGGGLAAHSPDGTPRWRRKDISAAAPPSIGPDGTVFSASLGGRLYVLEAATGRDGTGEALPAGRQGLSVGEAFLSHVAVGPDGTAYAVSARGRLVWYAADGRFGKVALPESDYALAPAVTAEGEVVVASSTGTVHRLPARPGGPPKAPFFQAGEPLRQGPLVDGAGRVLLITESGALVTVDPTGRSRPVNLGARGASPPAITRKGRLVFVTREGKVFAGGR